MKAIRVGAMLSLLALATSGDAQAATITVNSLTDDGPGDCNTQCTLRDAIATSQPGDTIAIDAVGTIVLDGAKGQITVGHDLTIAGKNTADSRVSGNDATRILSVTAGDVTIERVLFTNGRSVGDNGGAPTAGTKNGAGGALFVGANANVVLEMSAFENNQAIGGNGGNGTSSGNLRLAGGGGGAGGAGSVFNFSNMAGTPGAAGLFGGGGGGGVVNGEQNGMPGGFGGGGGGANGDGAGGAGGTGGGAGGRGYGNGMAGGGGGAGMGGAIFVEGKLTMFDVQFFANEAHGGNGGAPVSLSGGGGGGAGLGSSIFSTAGISVCAW